MTERANDTQDSTTLTGSAGYQATLWKKRIATITVLITILALVVYFSAWAYSKSQSRPLFGIFDIDYKCMGGHEIFLDLDSSDAFFNCPGHRDRKRAGRIIRSDTTVVVLDLLDSPWLRIDWDGSGYSLSFLQPPGGESKVGTIPAPVPIQQVTNPWRLWIPRLLPEE